MEGFQMSDVSTPMMRIIDRHVALIAASERSMARNRALSVNGERATIDSVNPLYRDDSARIMPTVAGAHGGNLAVTNMDSINNCRMRASQRPTIRIPAQVGPTSGYMELSQTPVGTGKSVTKPHHIASKHARKRAQLRRAGKSASR